jgi:hypothetical protein
MESSTLCTLKRWTRETHSRRRRSCCKRSRMRCQVARPAPAGEAAGPRLGRAEALGQGAPGGSGAQDPDNPAAHGAVVLVGAARLGFLWRESSPHVVRNCSTSSGSTVNVLMRMTGSPVSASCSANVTVRSISMICMMGLSSVHTASTARAPCGPLRCTVARAVRGCQQGCSACSARLGAPAQSR